MKISFIVIINLAVLLNVFKIIQIWFSQMNEKINLVNLSFIKEKCEIFCPF